MEIAGACADVAQFQLLSRRALQKENASECPAGPLPNKSWNLLGALRVIANYTELKSLALSLSLPNVTDTTAWGNPCLKAHGKMWCWWSPYVDAAVFKCDKQEREILLAADPVTFCCILITSPTT